MMRPNQTPFNDCDEQSFLDSDPKFIELKQGLRPNGQERPVRVRLLIDDLTAVHEKGAMFGQRLPIWRVAIEFRDRAEIQSREHSVLWCRVWLNKSDLPQILRSN